MSTVDTLFPPGASQRDWVADGFLAVSMTLVSIVPYLPPASAPASLSTMMALSTAMTMPLVLRRHAPLGALGLVSGGLWFVVWIVVRLRGRRQARAAAEHH